MSSAFVIEQQKQQLFGICEMVQSNIGTLMDQIARIASGIGQQQGKPKELLAEYEALNMLLKNSDKIKN
jgi:hypothetical protein